MNSQEAKEQNKEEKDTTVHENMIAKMMYHKNSNWEEMAMIVFCELIKWTYLFLQMVALLSFWKLIFHSEPNTFFLNQRMLSFLKSLSIYPPKKNKFWGQVGVNYFEASGIPSLDLTVDEKLVSEWVLPWKKWSLQSWTWSQHKACFPCSSVTILRPFLSCQSNIRTCLPTGIWCFPFSRCLGENLFSNLYIFFPPYIVGNKRLFFP